MKPLQIVLIDFSPILENNVLWNVIEPPLGLMALSAWQKRRFGKLIDISILQAKIDFHSFEEYATIINKRKPDVIGLRCLTISSNQTHQAARIAREKTNALIIAGGPYASSSPEKVVLDPNIDVAVIGEGELTFEAIIEHILDGADNWNSITGLCFLHNGKPQRTMIRPLIDDLTLLPIPDYDAVDLNQFEGLPGFSISSGKRALIQFSRGCPYTCAYCHEIMKKKFRVRPAKLVMSEILELYYKHGIRDFVFADDLFNLDTKNAEKFLKMIINESIKIRLFFPNGLRGDIITPSLIDLLTEAGMVEVNYALETGSPKMQKQIKKNLSIPKLINAVNYTTSKDVTVGLFLMMGFPDETEEEAEQTIDTLKKMPMVHFTYLNMVKLYEGTPLYQRAIENGYSSNSIDRSLNDSYDQYQQDVMPLSEKYVNTMRRKLIRNHIMNRDRLRYVLPIQRMLFSEKELELKYSTYLPGFKDMDQLDRKAYSSIRNYQQN